MGFMTCLQRCKVVKFRKKEKISWITDIYLEKLNSRNQRMNLQKWKKNIWIVKLLDLSPEKHVWRKLKRAKCVLVNNRIIFKFLNKDQTTYNFLWTLTGVNLRLPSLIIWHQCIAVECIEDRTGIVTYDFWREGKHCFCPSWKTEDCGASGEPC